MNMYIRVYKFICIYVYSIYMYIMYIQFIYIYIYIYIYKSENIHEYIYSCTWICM
jgi:hypothetical protein